MNQVIIALALFGIAACGRLDSQYLPPFQGGRSQGGHGGSSGSYSGAGSYSQGGSAGRQVPILRLDNDNNGDGTYNYAYETGNSISAHERGQPKGADGAVVADGSFSYTAPDGQQVSVSYVADENGFQPQGSHLPTSPPIPEAILKSIQQNLAEEARGGGGYSSGGGDDGQYRESQHGSGSGSGSGFRAGGNGGNGGYRY